jgi:hypothetical protein
MTNTNIIKTVAGNGNSGHSSGCGAASDAIFPSPSDIICSFQPVSNLQLFAQTIHATSGQKIWFPAGMHRRGEEESTGFCHLNH